MTLSRASIVIVCAVLCAAPAAGRDVERLDGGWLDATWTAADGFPNVHHTGVAVTPDGFLWIGSIDGLIRYDGVAFVRYRRGDLPGLPSNFVLSLAAHGPTNTLWMLTRSGHLASLHDGVVTEHLGVASVPGGGGSGVDPGAFARIDDRLYAVGEHGLFELTDRAVAGLPEALGGPVTWITKAGETLWVRRRGGDMLRRDPELPWRHGAGPPAPNDDRARLPVGRPDGSVVVADSQTVHWHV